MASGSANVRMFLRAADQRLEDARVLAEGGRDAGAMYLAGYAAECGLKAMLLAAVPASGERAILETFRGAAAHDLPALRARYRQAGGAGFSTEIIRTFAELSDWAVALRYDPRPGTPRESARFVASAQSVLAFCRNRSR
ncbi:HEPN domain-containing protein [Alienimonas californiensis]|uniref:HEPN domain-containing protein n=1 Tax=Alienimonas californiensis TaxID=2527989 RepID=UPI0011A82867